MRYATVLVALIVLGAVTAEARPSAPEAMREIGLLTCMPDGGGAATTGSSRRLRCTFEAYSRAQVRESYVGYLDRDGAESAGGETLAWSVWAAGGGARYGMLSGLFSGTRADVAVGPGPGADALMDRRGESIALDPVRRTGGAGPNLAFGATALELRPARSDDAFAPTAQLPSAVR